MLKYETNVKRVLNETESSNLVPGNHTYGAWNYLRVGKREERKYRSLKGRVTAL